jgi:hypothetical protein
VEQRLADMERRLARAERRSRIAGGVAVVGVVAALVLGAARPAVTDSPGSTLKAPFRVVDDKGKTRLYVEAEDDDFTLMQIYDGKGRVGVGMSSGMFRSGCLTLVGRNGKPCVSLNAGPYTGGSLTLYDDTGKETFEKP